MELLKSKIIVTPVGALKIVVNERALVAILWDNEKPNRVRVDQSIGENENPLILEVERQLQEYFQKQRKSFSLPIEARGTSFQQEVWKSLNHIPHGVTWTYGEMALRILRPKAVRAVAAAIGRNPISIVVPCHRVIAINGHLTGFAGGLERKKILLDLESKA